MGDVIYQVDPEAVTAVEGRVRKEFDKEKLQNLANSFLKIGQCQPGVCREEEREEAPVLILIAGERRLRACKLANLPFRYLLEEECSPLKALEIEVDENLQRVDLTWLEEVFALDKLHSFREMKGEQDGSRHSIRATAVAAERSMGQTSEDLQLATYAREIPEVAEAKTKGDAKKLIKKFKGAVLRQRFLSTATDKAEESKALTEEAKAKGATTEGGDEIISVGGVEYSTDTLLDYDQRVIEGKMEEKLNAFLDESIQIVLWDPPWGVNIDKKVGGNKHGFKDDPESVFAAFPGQLEQLYTKLALNSHLYLFFGIVHYDKIYRELRRVGFQVNGMPLIWYKQGSHVTQNPEIWPGRSYEPIAFARKGNKPLVVQGAPDVIITPAPTPAMKMDHPTAKHPDIYLELIKRSANPGDTVVDPMTGSGMAGVACEVYRPSLKLDWWLIEQDPVFRALALTNTLKGYDKIVNREPIDPAFAGKKKGKKTITAEELEAYKPPPLPEDFKTLSPGSNEWKRYWKQADATTQDSMLEWRKGKE